MKPHAEPQSNVCRIGYYSTQPHSCLHASIYAIDTEKQQQWYLKKGAQKSWVSVQLTHSQAFLYAHPTRSRFLFISVNANPINLDRPSSQDTVESVMRWSSAFWLRLFGLVVEEGEAHAVELCAELAISHMLLGGGSNILQATWAPQPQPWPKS